MSKYCPEIVKSICDLIEKDSYTDKEICEQVGISESIYYEWKAEKAEFSELLKKAEQKFLKSIATAARKSLVKKVEGYTVQEKRTVYASEVVKGKSTPRIKEQTITDKHYQPDTVAIIFALCNQDSENFKNKQSTEIGGIGGKPLFPERQLTDEELDAKIAILSEKHNAKQ